MKALERTVRFYDLEVNATIMVDKEKIDKAPPKMLDFLTEINELEAIQNGKIYYNNVDKSRYWSLDDIRIDTKNNKAILLIGSADSNEADMVLKDISKRKQTNVAKKKNNEGNGYSSHVCINLTPNQFNRYEFVMESTAGITATVFERLLRHLVKYLKSEKSELLKTEHPDSTPQKQKFSVLNLKFKSSGHPSDDIIRMINHNTLNNIEIITEITVTKSWDNNNLTKEKKETLQLSVENTPQSKGMQIVSAVCSKAYKDNKDIVRIRFKDDNNKTRSVDFDPQSKNILNEERCIKVEVLKNFTSRLETAYDNINDEIAKKMLVLI